MKKEYIKKLFTEHYGGEKEDVLCFFSPGRVNLIGEHIDYNGGLVFPGALSLGIYGAVRYRNDSIITLKSSTINNGEITFDFTKEVIFKEEDKWGNYPKGVARYLIDDGYIISGCQILYVSDLPDGAGLSSSAAIEVLTAYILLYKTLGYSIDRIHIAKLCQRVENEFIGVNCGIMDQFSVAMGKENMAILLDCGSLNFKYVSFILGEYSLVIMNSNKKRTLADSKYNERREECERALIKLKDNVNVKNLCEVNINNICKYLDDETLLKRARHVITENERVKRAVEFLDDGDLMSFGLLMTQSHRSLKNDYEVTGFELDTLVEEALMIEGCIGARMTGAGFGGCAIALVSNLKLDEFKEKVSRSYKNKTQLNVEFYISVINDGVKVF